MTVCVTHLSSVHPSTDTRIFVRECASLSKAGYHVRLIAAAPAPGETRHGVDVTVFSPSSSRLARMFVSIPRVVQLALRQAADVYHLHDPELLPFIPLLKRSGARVIYDAHEDLTLQLLTKPWIPSVLRPIISRVSAPVLPWLCGKADALVAATPVVQKAFPGVRSVIVHNYPLVDELAPPNEGGYQKRAALVVCIGGLENVRGAREMYNAMGLLPASTHAELAVAGRAESRSYLDEISRLPGAERVRYVGWQSRDAVRNLLSESRIGLLVEGPLPNHLEALPTKLFEYMSAGIPVVASDFPVWREIVDGVGCGKLVDPLQPAEIAEALAWLLEHPREAEEMGKRGRQAVLERFNWQTEADTLIGLYNDLVGK